MVRQHQQPRRRFAGAGLGGVDQGDGAGAGGTDGVPSWGDEVTEWYARGGGRVKEEGETSGPLHLVEAFERTSPPERYGARRSGRRGSGVCLGWRPLCGKVGRARAPGEEFPRTRHGPYWIGAGKGVHLMASALDLQGELERLRAELAERRATIPAHTVRVHQMAQLEDLEDRVRELEERLSQGGEGPQGGDR